MAGGINEVDFMSAAMVARREVKLNLSVSVRVAGKTDKNDGGE
jgi:hypothetical protein